MTSIEPPVGNCASGVTRTRKRCEKCKKFARLLPGDTSCAACTGALALEFGNITSTSHTTVRGGY
nr:hypothetical protein [Kibdelosporangium sp. MJ126-NF4]